VAKRKGAAANLARIALNAGRRQAKAETETVDIVTFIQSDWGLGVKLFPVQRVILKAHYGLELDDDPNNTFTITDWKRENAQEFTEAGYLRWLYDNKRCNISEVVPGKERRTLVLPIGRRSGKCVVGDTLLLTNEGVRQIREYDTIDSYLDFPDEDHYPLALTVAQEGPQARSESSYFYRGGHREIVRMRTACGFEIAGTPNHRIKVMGADGKIQWRYLDELQINDQVAVHRNTDLWVSDYVDTTELAQSANQRGRKNLELPTKLDEEWGLLLGLLAGGGNWPSKNTVSMTVEHEEVWEKASALFAKLLGEPSRVMDRRTVNTGALQFYSVAARSFLHGLGFDWNCDRYNKRTPHTIMRSPRPVVQAFLRGLFETDGGVEAGGKTVSFSTASSELAREVQTLLLNLGIVSRRKSKWDVKTKRDYYIVSVRGLRSRMLFAERVGFMSHKKMDPLCDSIRVASREGGDTESIPHQREWCCRLLESVPKDHKSTGKGWQRSKLREKLGNTIKPSATEEMTYPRWEQTRVVACEVGADPDLIAHFDAIADADYFYDPVVSLAEDEATVYDLCVPDGASFVANGLTNHNTMISACIAAYETYKLINKGNPQKYYGVAPSNPIRLVSVATGKEQAGLLYEEVSHHFAKCLSGETEIITDRGIFPIGELVGTEQVLLTGDGSWVKAPIRSFGRQRLYEIRLKRQGREKVIYATKDHRWFATDARKAYRGKGYQEFTTDELRPEKHRLKMAFGRSWKNRVNPSPFGIAHGFVFGDGSTKPGTRNANTANLIGAKDQALFPYFSMCPQAERPSIDSVEVAALPNFFRELPNIQENKAYLLGWLMGYFAADGTVMKDGGILLYSASHRNLKFAEGVCALLGIGTYGIRYQDRISNMTGRESRMYSLRLMGHTLNDDFFLIEHHRKNYQDTGAAELKRDATKWRVVSVTETDRVEEVFCATVEGHGDFTLAGNIVTGNCNFFKRYTANNTMSYARFQTPHDIEEFGSYVENPQARASIKVFFAACNAKSLRGQGNIVIILDEVAHFLEQGGSSAEEVYGAVSPSNAAFTPKNEFGEPIDGVDDTESDGRIIMISSPLGKQGLFFKKFMQGMSGQKGADNILCVQAPTWEVNPTIPASYFKEHFAFDPRMFFQEFGAEFSDRTMGWLEDAKDLLDCIDKTAKEKHRGQARTPYFVGFDLGLVKDASAIAITHINEKQQIVLDYIGQIKAGEGDFINKDRLDFEEIAAWIHLLSRRFHFHRGMFDQYAAIPLEQALHKKGLSMFEGKLFTPREKSDIWANFKSMMWDRVGGEPRLVLYDLDDRTKAKLQEKGEEVPEHLLYIQQILSLQATYKSQYIVEVEAPQTEGKHDDLADALARSIYLASLHLGKMKHIARSKKNVYPGQPQVSAEARRRSRRKRMLGGSDPKRQVPRTRRR